VVPAGTRLGLHGRLTISALGGGRRLVPMLRGVFAASTTML
jgi:hypothetical protein